MLYCVICTCTFLFGFAEEMVWQKIGVWLLTKSGKTFSYFFAGGVTTSVMCGSFLPHTLFLEKYKEFVQLYKDGRSVTVSPKVLRRFDKAMDLLQVEELQRALSTPFYSYGLDLLSAGSYYSKYGVIVGLPVNFSFDSINDQQVEEFKSKFMVKHKSVSWDSPEGRQLLNTLVLSEEAQLYAMAREIKYRQTMKPLFDVFVSISSCLLAYGASNHINEKFNLYVKPRFVRLALYTLVGFFAFGTYAMLKDLSQIYYERCIDEELKGTDVAFLKGGYEFYSKMLERNKALRKLLGREGQKIYSVLGNELYFLRTKHIPLVQRKAFFEEPVAVANNALVT